MTNPRPFLRNLWTLTRPYWFSEERWAARGLLAIIVALKLGIVFLEVPFNRWQSDFYDALQDKNITAFYDLLVYFSALAAAFVAAAVYQLYLNQMLQIRWPLSSRSCGASPGRSNSRSAAPASTSPDTWSGSR